MSTTDAASEPLTAEERRREREIIAGIHRGMEDARAGRVIDHEEAMDRIDALIDEIEARQAR